MAKYLPLPDGSSLKVPDDMSYAEAMGKAQRKFPELFATKADVAPPKTGMLAAAQSGLGSLASSMAAGAESFVGDAAAAGKRANARDAKQATEYADQIGLKQLGAAYDTGGIYGGAKELVRQVPLALAQQAPNLALMAGTAKAGAMAGTAAAPFLGPLAPAAPVVGGILGAFAPSALSQLGSNVARQTQENPDTPVDMGRAGTAAVVQGGLETVATAVPLGKTLIGKLLGPQVEKMLATTGAKGISQAEKLAAEKLMPLLAKGTAVGILAEVPTEVTQSMLERWQAGKDLFSPDAIGEYKETAYQTSLLGPLGAAGRYVDRGAAANKVAGIAAEKENVRTSQEAAAKATAETARLQDPNYLPNLQQRADAFNTQRAALTTAAGVKVDPNDVVAAAEKVSAKKALQEFSKSEESQALFNELREAAPALQKRKAEAAQAAAEQAKAAQAAAVVTPEATAQMWEEHDAAEAAKTQSHKAMQDALRAGDTGAAAQHLDAFENYQTAQQKILTTAPPRAVVAPTPDEVQQDARIQALTGGVNAKGKPRAGLIEKLVGEGDVAGAKTLMGELQTLQEAQGVRKAGQARVAQSTDAAALRMSQLQEEEGSVTPPPPPVQAAPPAAVAPAPIPETPKPPEMGGQLSGPTRAQRWKDANLTAEVQDMADNRLDTSRTEQTSLLDSPANTFVDAERNAVVERQELENALKTARSSGDRRGADIALEKLRDWTEKRQSIQANMGSRGSTNPLPVPLGENIKTGPARPAEAPVATDTALTPTTATADSVRKQIASLPETLPEHHEEMVARVQSNLSAIAQSPARLNQVSDYLYGIRTGRAERNVADDGAADNFRSRDIANMLDTLEQGKRSETETTNGNTRTAVQGDMFPGAGTRQVEHDLTYMEQGPRKITQVNAPRIFPTQAAFDKFLGSETLQRMRVMAGNTVQTISRAVRMVQPLQARIEALTKNIAAEQAKYEKMVRTTDGTVASVDMAHAVAKRRFDAAVAKLDAELAPLQAAYLKAQVALKENTDYSKDLTESLIANRDKLGAVHADTAAAMGGLLEAKQVLSEMLTRSVSKDNYDGARTQQREIGRLTDALALKREQMTPVVEAYLNRERIYQKRLGENLAELGQLHADYSQAKTALGTLAAKQQMRTAVLRDMPAAKAEMADVEAYRKQVVAEGQAARDANQQERDKLRAEMAATKQKIEDTLRPVEEARDARLPKKEAEGLNEFRTTPEDTARSQRADTASGQRKAKEQQTLEAREAMPGEFIDNSKYRKARDAAPVDTVRAERKAMLDEKSQDESLPKTTRDKARRDFLKMEREDATSEARSGAQVELDRLTNERIPELQQQVADAPSESNKQELNRARNAAAKLRSLLQRAKRTTVGPTQSAETEAIEPGVRSEIKGRVSQASKKELLAGEQRTGSEESKGNVTRTNALTGQTDTITNKTGSGNKVQEQRRVKDRTGPVSRAEQLAANDAAAELAKANPSLEKSTQEWYAETTKAIEQQLDTLRKELVDAEAKVADTVARPKKYSPEEVTAANRMVDIVKGEIASAENDIAAREAAMVEETALPTGKTVTTLTGTDWSGEYESSAYEDNYAPSKANRAARASTDMSAALSEAVADGRILDAADALVKAGFPLAGKIRSLLLRTKLRVELDPKDKDGNSVAGMYYPETNTIVMREDAYAEDVLHEMVHAATDAILLADPKTLTPEQAKARRSLEGMHKLVSTNASFANEEIPNVREFVAEAMSNPEFQAKLASMGSPVSLWQRFLNIFRGLFDRTLYTPLTKVQDDISKIMSASKRTKATGGKALATPSLRRQAAPVPDTLKHIAASAAAYTDQKKPWYAKFKMSALGMETMLVDRFAPLEKLSRTMDSLKGSQMMYYLRMYDQRFNYVSQAASNGVPQLVAKTRKDGATEYVIESVKGANLKEIAEVLRSSGLDPDMANGLFTQYLAAIRAQRVGAATLSIDGYTDAKAKKDIDDVNNTPKVKAAFDKAREMYNEYNKNLIDFAVQAGAISKEVGDKLSASKDYIPFYRTDGDNVAFVLGGENIFTVGNIKQQPYLQELVGGNKPIMSFLDSSVQNTGMLVDMAMRNIATKNAAMELEALGMATVRKDTGQNGPDIVRFKIRGVEHAAKIDTPEGIPADLLVRGMEGIPTQLPGIVQALGMPAKLLRKMVTLSPLYAARQLFRDSIGASIMSGANTVPILSALKEIGSVNKKVLENRGIVGGQIFTGTQEDMAKVLRDVTAGKSGWLNGLAKLESMTMEADAVTRRAQYASYIKQGLSEMEASLLALESMNFSKRGASPSIHYANALIPFFNAQIQSLNVLQKSAAGNMPFNERLRTREKMVTRGMMLAASTMVYASMMSDDEAYKNAPPERKYGGWLVRVPGLDEPVWVPVPFEIGYIFKSVPEALFNTMNTEGGGEEAMKAFKTILVNTIPGGSSYGIPQAIKPLIEVGTGKSFWTGRDILSSAESRLDPEYQYRDGTSEAAKQLGAATGTSPILLETLVRGYTSTVGAMAMAAVSAALPATEGPQTPAKLASQLPGIGSMFQSNDAGAIVSATYEEMGKLTRLKDSVNALLERGRDEEAMRLIDSRAEEYALTDFPADFQQAMNAITEADKAVRGDSKLTPEEKRDYLLASKKERTETAKMFRDVLRKSLSAAPA
jgi:hypothetical protein